MATVDELMGELRDRAAIRKMAASLREFRIAQSKLSSDALRLISCIRFSEEFEDEEELPGDAFDRMADTLEEIARRMEPSC